MQWNVDPVIFKLFGLLEVRYYSLLFAFGLFFALNRVSAFMIQEKYPEEYPEKIFLYIVIFLILGAHFVHLIFYEPGSLTNWKRIISLGSGLASHGGVLGSLFGLWLFCRLNQLALAQFLQITDMVAAVVGVTGGCIRLGNFFNSEIIGRVTDVPWAITFLKVDHHPRHPAQLYESIALFAMAAFFYPLYKQQKERRRPGFFMFLFLCIYFIIRFLVEFVKEYQSEFVQSSATLTMGQWLSLPVVLVTGFMVYKTSSK